MRRWLKGLLLGALFVTLSMPLAHAAESVLEGDQIDYDFRSGWANVKGHVVLTRPDGTRIVGEKGKYNSNSKEGAVQGKVVMTQKDGKGHCDELILAPGGDLISAIGNAYIKKKDKAVSAPKIDYHQKREFVETKGRGSLMMDDGSYINANYMNYDAKTGLAHGEGRIEMDNKVNNIKGEADKVDYDMKKDDGTIVLTGNAKVIQKGDSLKGARLVIKGANAKKVDKGQPTKDKKADKGQPVQDKKATEAYGNVCLVYVPKDDKPKAKKAAPAAAPLPQTKIETKVIA